MFHRDRNDLGRWYGLAGAVGLLALCLVLLSGQAATAENGPAFSLDQHSPRVATDRANDAALSSQPSSSTSSMASRRAGLTPSRWRAWADATRDDMRLVPDGLRTGAGAPTFGAGGPAQGPQLMAPPVPGEDLIVCMTTDRVWGALDYVGAGTIVTVEVDGQQMGAGLADDAGFFWTTLYDTNGDRPYLDGGEQVAIHMGGVQAKSVSLRSVSGQIDVMNDIVSGTIGGVSSAMDVTVYVGSSEPTMASYSQTVSTNSTGGFVVDFSGVFDLISWHEAIVAYEDSGVEVHGHVYARDSLQVRPAPWNRVRGAAAPGTKVTATLYHGNMTEKASDTVDADDTSGSYSWNVPTDVLPSEVVVVEMAGGTTLSRTVGILNAQVDAANDRLTGQAEPNSTVRAVVGTVTENGWRDMNGSTTASSSGYYTIELGSIVDVMPGQWAGVFVADAEGDELGVWNHAPSVDVNQTWNDVSGAGPADPGPGNVGKAVTVTFASTSTVYRAPLDWWGFYGLSQEEAGLPDIVPGEVVTVEMDGFAWQGVVEVKPITVEADLDLDRFEGTIIPPSNRVEVSGWVNQSHLYPLAGSFDTIDTASSDFGAEPPGFDVNYSLSYDVAHRTGDDYVNRVSGNLDGFAVFLPPSAVVGQMNPAGTPFTITLKDSGGSVKAEITGTSQEPAGRIGWNDFGWQEQSIEAGDLVQVQSGAGFSQTVSIPDIAVVPDLGSGVVSGSGPENSLMLFEVESQGIGFVPTGSSGDYAFAVDQLQDAQEGAALAWGQWIDALYRDENRVWVIDSYNWPQIVASYDMEGRQEVWGQYAVPGSSIDITVTHPISGVLESGTVVAGACDWCAPGDYQFDVPDGTLEPGNVVTVSFLGSGLLDSIVVHAVSAEANANTDVVTVTTEPGTTVFINADGPNGWWDWHWDHESVEVGPSGVVVFDLGGEYDIVSGTRFNVHVEQAHAHQTHYAFWLPAPDMQVEKWTQGSDQVAPDGPIVYRIRYRNEGDEVANQVVLTDTLHLETSYHSDSSAATAIDNGDSVVWNLGSVQPGEDVEFELVLYNTAISGTVLLNQADIWTEIDSDEGNNHAEAEVRVVDEEGNPYVNKRATPDRPAAGGTFLYEIDYGNGGPVAAGPVVLTDILPDDTYVVDWFSENGYGLWEDVSSSGQFVLQAPAIPGHWGDRIYLRLQVEPGVAYDTRLTNTVEIELAGKIESHENSDARVEGPYWDSYVGKQFNWGELVPGGQVEYNVHVRNQGNQATQTWLTDTLPAGTTLAGSWSWDGQTSTEFPYYGIDGQKVVWDMGQMLPGAWKNLDIRLDIDPSVQSGDDLVNCVEISIDGEDGWPDDNEDCVTDPVRESGPNLRVYKEHQWEDDNQRLRYQIRVENIGTVLLENVWFTDTYPVDTTFGGEWWVHHGPHIELNSHDEGNRQLIFWAQEFGPGETANIELRVEVDQPTPPVRWYTNTVEVDVPPGDRNPGDNYYEDGVFSGGEVEWVDFDVNRDWFWGCAHDVPITVKTASEQMIIDGDRCWNEAFPAPFLPGDIVTITAGAGGLPVVIEIPNPFTAYLSSETNEVWGVIDHLDGEMVDVDVWDLPRKRVPASGGQYRAVFDDIPRGSGGDVRYRTEVDYAEVGFHGRIESLDLVLDINYDHEWVEGQYEAGHTIWITVTESDGVTVKSSAEITTGLIPDWGDQSGFRTEWDDWVPGPGVDIEPGDRVKGLVDNGQTADVKVGWIKGTMSTLTDRIRGTVEATGIDEGVEVEIECHPWIESGNPPSKHDTVFPDGLDTYLCAWDPDTEWDIQMHEDLAVSYEEPDGDRVFAVFHISAQVHLPVVLRNH